MSVSVNVQYYFYFGVSKRDLTRYKADDLKKALFFFKKRQVPDHDGHQG